MQGTGLHSAGEFGGRLARGGISQLNTPHEAHAAHLTDPGMRSERREEGAVTLTVQEAAYAANVSLRTARQAISRRQIKVRQFRRKADRARQGVGPAEAVFLRVQGMLSPTWKKRFYQKLYGKSLGELPRRFEAENVVMDLTPAIDYIGLAKSLGVPGERVEKTQDVGGAVGRGLASGGPYLIDVKIDAAFK